MFSLLLYACIWVLWLCMCFAIFLWIACSLSCVRVYNIGAAYTLSAQKAIRFLVVWTPIRWIKTISCRLRSIEHHPVPGDPSAGVPSNTTLYRVSRLLAFHRTPLCTGCPVCWRSIEHHSVPGVPSAGVPSNTILY
jgi:hypothetical protein